MEEPRHAWYWAIIPGEVMRCEKLSDCEKLLYAEVSTLAQEAGYCFAGNDYLAEQMNKSERTIARGLSKLHELGFIRIEAVHGQRNTIMQRRIYAGINPALPPDSSSAKNGKTDSVLPNLSPSSAKNGKAHLIENKILDNPPVAPQGPARGNGKVPAWKPERFEKFWEYYPPQPGGSKPAKARAVKAWDKLRPDDATIRQMATALQRQKASEQWQRGIGIPYASSWLNGRRWEDEYEAPEDPEEPETFDEEDLPEWT